MATNSGLLKNSPLYGHIGIAAINKNDIYFLGIDLREADANHLYNYLPPGRISVIT